MSRHPTEPPVIPAERGEDLRGLEHAGRADLVLFMAGNQFMAMEELLAAFRRRRPEIERVFYETLPPRLEMKQILAGGAHFNDEFIDTPADVYTSVSEDAMRELASHGLARRDGWFAYLKNRLGVMVAAGNPKEIHEVADLARDDVRVSQPNPEFENIAEHILNMYRDAGGEEMVRKIMHDKRESGTTIMTTVHHRETPRRILEGEADAGPVWATEIIRARSCGADLEGVEVGEELDQRDNIRYYACRIEAGNNPENADKFLEFLKSDKAGAIYEKYGFTR